MVLTQDDRCLYERGTLETDTPGENHGTMKPGTGRCFDKPRKDGQLTAALGLGWNTVPHSLRGTPVSEHAASRTGRDDTSGVEAIGPRHLVRAAPALTQGGGEVPGPREAGHVLRPLSLLGWAVAR